MRGQKLSSIKVILAALVVFVAVKPAIAADLPLAAGSPLAGFSFDDRPLLLSVQRNFQMAMLTSSSEIGRSCGRMESYGWRMNQSEQQRVNLIFNNTVDRLRALGYVVESKSPHSLSRDVTLFTADRPDKHFIFMWSAGEIGLVMVLCESSAPLTGPGSPAARGTKSVQVFPPPTDVLQSRLETPVQKRNAKGAVAKFSPVGDWVGDYTCMQGYTGGTLHIDSLKGEDFTGTFRFYPTAKNRYVAKGSYAVYGQYDDESHRILINPGKWLERPKNYYNTIIVGSFDPATHTFSGFFQGIMGCTSFEARYRGASHELAQSKPVHKKKAKKKTRKKPPVKPAATTSGASTAEPASSTPPAVQSPAEGINLPDNSAASPPAATQPGTSAPPAPVPAPPPVSPPPLAVPAAQPAAAPAANSPPTPITPAPAPPAPPKPTSMRKEGWIVVASVSQIQQAPVLAPAQTFNTTVPQIAPAQTYNTNVPQINQAPTLPLAQQAPQPNYVAPSVPEISQANEISPPQEAPPPAYFNATVPQIQPAPQLPPPEVYNDP